MASPPFRRNEVGDGHRLIAVWARPAGANPATEPLTLGTALLAHGATQAVRTLVDDVGPRQTGRHSRQRCRVAPPPGGLAAGIRAVTAPTHWHKRPPADRTRYRCRIVTRRGLRIRP